MFQKNLPRSLVEQHDIHGVFSRGYCGRKNGLVGEFLVECGHFERAGGEEQLYDRKRREKTGSGEEPAETRRMERRREKSAGGT